MTPAPSTLSHVKLYVDLWKLRFTCAFIITTWSHSDELRELSATPTKFLTLCYDQEMISVLILQ